MIRVTRLDKSEFYLNAEFILSVESTPDTQIVLLGGAKYVVTEPDHEVVERIMEYRRAAYSGGGPAPNLRLVEN